jgi:hypothetical protein
MVYLAEPGMFVAVGIPYDVYFLSGRYYYFHGDNWFWASGYSGPWVHVVRKNLPPGLTKYKVVQLRDFREREYKAYKTQGPKFKGQKFSAEPGNSMAKSSKGESQASSPGNGGGSNGKGKGRGK